MGNSEKKLGKPIVQSLALQCYIPLVNATQQAEERQPYFALENLLQTLDDLHDLASKGARCDLVLLFAFNA